MGVKDVADFLLVLVIGLIVVGLVREIVEAFYRKSTFPPRRVRRKHQTRTPVQRGCRKPKFRAPARRI